MSVMAVIKLWAQKGRGEDLLVTVQEPVQLTREHPECSLVSLLQDADNPDLIVFVETWSSVDAHTRHVELMVKAGQLTAVIPLLGSDIETHHYHAID